jgi:C-terminal processing protease CtpA/Prc
VIDNIAARLKGSYILPEMAGQLIAALQAHQQQGDYDGLTDAAAFANRLTYDLQIVSHDRHLRIEYSADKLPPEQGGPSAEEEEAYHKELNRTNCGFERVEVLPGNVGYVRFDYFGAPDECADTAATAMKFVAHTDAVIFDLRQNHGGDPAMVALLASYLFDRPTHLDDLYNRRENKTTQYWATPEKVTDKLPTQPVYVLTSRMTFSGAEQFSYDLRNLHRAILIGERTGGAAHPTRNHRLDDHFLIATPEYRYINAVTKTDWEGAGVEPDVPAAPWSALMTAEKAALVRLHRTNTRPLPVTASR